MVHLENKNRSRGERTEEGVLSNPIEGAGDRIASPPRGIAQLQSLQGKGVNVLHGIATIRQGQMASESVLTHQEETGGNVDARDNKVQPQEVLGMVRGTDLAPGGAEVLLFKQDRAANPKPQAEDGAINRILFVAEISTGSGGKIPAHSHRRNRPHD